MSAKEDNKTPNPDNTNPDSTPAEGSGTEPSGSRERRRPIPNYRNGDELLFSRERILRRIAAEGPMSANDLVGPGCSSATAFRALAELADRGLIAGDEAGVYRITNEGLAWIARRDASTQTEPDLRALIPALACVPTVIHYCYLVLALFACVIRFYRIFDRSLSGFVLIGPPSSFKTTIARALVALVGGDPDTDVINLPGQTGHDLLIRRGSRGEEVTRSRLLEIAAAIYDELGNTRDPAVRRDLEHVIMHGELMVSLGNETYLVLVTPTVIMNPLAGTDATFVQQTGLSEATERRTIVVPFTGVDIPAEVRDRDWLQELIETDRARRVKLPRPRNPELRCGPRVRKALEAILRDPTIIGSRVDHMLIAQLAVGGTAWLPDEEAFRIVLWAWARLAALRGLLREDWGLVLTRELSPEMLPAVAAPTLPTAPTQSSTFTIPPVTLTSSASGAGSAGLEPRIDRAEVEAITAHLTDMARIVVSTYGGDYEMAKDRLRMRGRLRREEGVELFDGVEYARSARRLGLPLEDGRYCMHFGRDVDALARRLGIYNQDVFYFLELGVRTYALGWTLRHLPPPRPHR